eukprot:GFUD01070421.1.p1 GENE.GFUD01070421.1~~GFUD01070421.1.p1  ORF type:complete len:306 (+),score=77.08 GFUD01070421.1:149-1066(+)
MFHFFDTDHRQALSKDKQTSYNQSDGIKVIGAGLPRTGTLSLKTALTQLYSGKCYHGVDVFAGDQEDVDVWMKAARREMKPEDWREYFGKKSTYVAGVDFPFSLFYKDIMAAYPDAKVVLSTRESSTWFHSVYNSVYQIDILMKDYPTVPLLLGMLDRRKPAAMEMFKIIGEIVPSGGEVCFREAMEGGPNVAEKFFTDWEAEVRRSVPSDRLLVASAKEGWAPLCKFVGLPAPENDYPRVNDRASIKMLLWNLWIINGLVFYVLPPSIAVAGYVYRSEIALVVQTLGQTVLAWADLIMDKLFKQ